MNSELLVCGTKVWIEGMRTGQRVRFWKSVLKRTRTQIVLADQFYRRFRRETLMEIGGHGDRIVSIATDEEISAFEVEQAVRREQEKLLEEELRSLIRLVMGYPVEINRRADRYEFRTVASAAQVRAMFAAMKGSRPQGR